MTSEVAVMNRLAVALAADSAVTASRKKVYNSANKLFMLSVTDPVGVMVYNNSSLMHVPWETLIKDFRSRLGSKSFPHLPDYGDAFFRYLEGRMDLFPREVQVRYYFDLIERYFKLIAKKIRLALNRLQSGFEEARNDEALATERARIYREVLNEVAGPWSKAPRSRRMAKTAVEDLLGSRSGRIYELEMKYFRVPHPSFGREEMEKIRAFVANLVEREWIAPDTLSGVVVAGFGSDDFFPVLQEFQVGEVYGDRLKYRRKPLVKIDEQNGAHIQTFADSDTADAFLHGLPADFERRIVELAYEATEEVSRQAVARVEGLTKQQRTSLAAALEEVRADEGLRFLAGVEYHKQCHYVGPTADAILNLPKDELAHVASSLVNINLLKKRMSMALETVGGPIDVAVISKGDGFIWIDRKHYFSPEKNPQFLHTHYGRSGQALADPDESQERQDRSQ
jgi:hypothetical protein